jgi:hypothetical protein
MRHPLVGILGNSVVFLTGNFVPTLFPLAGWWNHSVLSFLPHNLSALLLANFEGDFYKLGEIPIEEQAGLGFGVSCLLAANVLATLCQRPGHFWRWFAWPRGAVLLAAYVSLFFFFAKSGMETLPRLVSAYYPLLIPALLVSPVSGAIVRHRWWRRATGVVLGLSFAVVILTPARPLWPAQTVLSKVPANESGHSFIKRVKEVYRVYAERPDPLAKARAALPEDCPIIGFAADADDSEVSVWRPYGHRRAEQILPGDSVQEIQARGIQYALVGELYLAVHHQTIQSWLQEHQASLMTSVTATMTIQEGPLSWYVVRFDAPSPTQTPDK